MTTVQNFDSYTDNRFSDVVAQRRSYTEWLGLHIDNVNHIGQLTDPATHVSTVDQRATHAPYDRCRLQLTEDFSDYNQHERSESGVFGSSMFTLNDPPRACATCPYGCNNQGFCNMYTGECHC